MAAEILPPKTAARIFVLRHEQRSSQDATFHSPLLAVGQQRAAEQVVETLRSLSVTHLYTSPFLRCLQTIAPFCRTTGDTAACTTMANVGRCPPSRLRLRREFALYERITLETGRPNSFRHDVRSGDPYHDLLDPTYVSHWPLENLQWSESEDDVRARATSFLQFCTQHHAAHDVVVLVTHRSVVNALLGREPEEPFPMGQLEEICSLVGDPTEKGKDEL